MNRIGTKDDAWLSREVKNQSAFLIRHEDYLRNWILPNMTDKDAILDVNSYANKREIE